MIKRFIFTLFLFNNILAGYVGDPKPYNSNTTLINMLDYLQENKSRYNISSWDLQPVSVSDWSSIIQDAIKSLPDEGGCIYFPSGIYKITKDIKISSDEYDLHPNKPINLCGSTYTNTAYGNTGGSVIRRIGQGNVIRINLNDQNYSSYTKVYHGFTVSNLTLEGDGSDITAIRGYRSRIALNNVVFNHCKNGLSLNSLGSVEDTKNPGHFLENQCDYSDLSYITNLRIQNSIGGCGVNIRGADATVLSGIYMEGGSLSEGIKIECTQGTKISDILINNADTGIQLNYCNGIAIAGWHSEGIGQYGLLCVHGTAIDINGFHIEGSNINHVFHFDNKSFGNTIRNGVVNAILQAHDGFDLYTQVDETAPIPIYCSSFDNVICKSSDIIRSPKFAGFGGGIPAKYSSSTLELKGQNFLQILDNYGNKSFVVDNSGELTVKKIKFLDGTTKISGNGTQIQKYTIIITDNTAMGWVHSLFTDHNSVGNTVSIWGEQIQNRLPKVGDWLIVDSKPYMVVNSGNNLEISVPINEDTSVVTWLRDSIITTHQPLNVIQYTE